LSAQGIDPGAAPVGMTNPCAKGDEFSC